MSTSSSMSLYEIRMEGWKALTERLGPSGAMRFMMQYDSGYGDYSKATSRFAIPGDSSEATKDLVIAFETAPSEHEVLRRKTVAQNGGHPRARSARLYADMPRWPIAMSVC